MKLDFIDWLKRQNFDSEVINLFEEASKCYKTQAYHAALLFSYLGFQSIIKARILNAQPPKGYKENYWESIQEDLLDDNKWDHVIFESLTRKKPAPIFIISDDLRHQIEYWKNRRNDCAHFKDNLINNSHVESFWVFLRSNLSKLVVNGSRESLLNKIVDHFDSSLTSPGSDFQYLVDEIPHAVEVRHLENFYKDLFQFFKTLPLFPFDPLPQEAIKFVARIFELDSDPPVDKLKSYLKNDLESLTSLLDYNPQLIVYFSGNDTFIRKYWYDHIDKSKKVFEILSAMLSHNLIPDGEKKEAIKHIIKKTGLGTPSKDNHPILEQFGFFEEFKKIAFEDEKIWSFNWSNSNYNLVVYYLQNFEIDEVVAKALSNNFSNDNFPFELRDALNRFFSNNPEKRKKTAKIIVENKFKKAYKIPALYEEQAEEGSQ
ncbi:hypothetical protein [Halalkalibaculum sp. DA384]|uniref:hypothetical protein n=1 Tax=Halalkalibaculum sp. DA384 TaxID=3373606 RepID=UPI003754C8D4